MIVLQVLEDTTLCDNFSIQLYEKAYISLFWSSNLKEVYRSTAISHLLDVHQFISLQKGV